jgi:hypothetical protein
VQDQKLNPCAFNSAERNYYTCCIWRMWQIKFDLTSLMLLWPNGSKSSQQCSNIYWKAFPGEWMLL